MGAGRLAERENSILIADSGRQQLVWDRNTQCVEKHGDLAVELDANVGDLRDAEAPELRARLVEREPGWPVRSFPYLGAQRRVQHDPGVVTEHPLGSHMIPHQVRGAS